MDRDRDWFKRQAERSKIDINILPSFMLSEDNLRERAGMSRSEKVEALIHIFYSSFAEDPHNGTDFDCAIIKTLENLKSNYR